VLYGRHYFLLSKKDCIVTPQIGIFQEGAKHMYFLEYTLLADDIQPLKNSLQISLQQHNDSTVVLGFGLHAWQRLQPSWSPHSLANFQPLTGLEGHSAPSTQADIFYWIQGQDIAKVYDTVLHIHQCLKNHATLTLEQRGFDYHQKLDLIGFEDGSANPKTDSLKRDAACITIGKTGAGGSLVLSQKWVHDLEKWNQTPVHCQEKVVGRKKDTNEELTGNAMPNNSHISRTDLTIDGEAMKIYRRSAPFGTLAEKGLMFLAFGCELKRFSTQLDSMYGVAKEEDQDQPIDQLLNYSKAVSSSYWFAPTQEDLAEMLKV